MMKRICFLGGFLCCLFPLHAQRITTPGAEYLQYELIPNYELPKQYILDGRTKTYPAEGAFRRMDIVFFLAIPVTFYLFYNFLSLINVANIATGNFDAGVPRDRVGFTMAEWNFVLAATFLIPSGVAIYDYVYARDYPLLPPFQRDEFREVRMSFTIFRTKF